MKIVLEKTIKYSKLILSRLANWKDARINQKETRMSEDKEDFSRSYITNKRELFSLNVFTRWGKAPILFNLLLHFHSHFSYLILINVELTFLYFDGIDAPVPKKTTS